MDDSGLRAANEPLLSEEEHQHQQRMTAHIRAQIHAAGGWISFERFMELALYAPGLGYYSAGARKFGAEGDFVTAPEVSPMFGGCVARQCVQVFAQLKKSTLLEIGAGTGRLAVDILRRLDMLAKLPDAYEILEVSADLRDRQRALLAAQIPHLMPRVRWLDAPREEAFDGVIVANEVLDALPVAHFVWRPIGIEEWGVQANGLQLCSSLRTARPDVVALVQELHTEVGSHWPAGYTSEVCPRICAWARATTRALRRGAVLWIDYGLPRAQYYLADRFEGTLQTHMRHRAGNDPLLHPGLADISAWVDFTALARAGELAGFDIAGFTTQTYFLTALALDEEMRLRASAGAAAVIAAGEARRLVMPGEMGERFKVMGWTRGYDAPLRGFELLDLLPSL